MVTLEPGSNDDVEALAALRVLAMRESLERVGRFDPQRARERFVSAFSAAHTRHVCLDGRRVGFVVVRPQGEGLLLDHLELESLLRTPRLRARRGRRVGQLLPAEGARRVKLRWRKP